MTIARATPRLHIDQRGARIINMKLGVHAGSGFLWSGAPFVQERYGVRDAAASGPCADRTHSYGCTLQQCLPIFGIDD